MRNLIIVFVIVFNVVAFKVSAQGIDFRHIALDEALQQAREQDKLVFVDFYTQWCGPCKKMANGPFLEKKVGDYYNENFISLKLDAEKEGLQAAREYKVISYPTLLFIDGNGKMVFTSHGRNGEALIQSGKDALSAVEGEYTFEKLNEQFEKHLDNERFLKLYMTKMKDFGASFAKGIEAWLKVQTEINESDTAMMYFLFDNVGDLTVGGKADDILNGNYDTWKKNCDERTLRRLNSLQQGMLYNTRRQAYRLNDPELLKLYIHGVAKLEDDSRHKQNLFVDELRFYVMKKDYETFRKKAEESVDSLMKSINIKEIHKEDKSKYEKYRELNGDKDNSTTQRMLLTYKFGISAIQPVKKIEEIGEEYLKYATDKSHFKELNKWISFCYKLVPDYYIVDNLKANVLYKMGDHKKAIALKKAAIEKYPSNEKKLVNKKYELQQMIDGKEVF